MNAKFEHDQFEKDAENDDKKTGPVEVDSNGEIKLTGLLPGDYQLQEVQAPAGYIITIGTFEFNISGTGSLTPKSELPELITYVAETDTDLAGYQIENEPGVALPSTGGSGTRLFTIFGSTLILGAGMMLVKRRRRLV